jgi:predicted ATPase
MQPESFGALLLGHRRAAGLSQEVLAERAQLSVNAIQALERGRRTTPRRSTVDLLASGLGLDGAARARLIAAAGRPATATQEQSEAAVAAAAALPVLPGALLGRERELAEVVDVLKAGERLVTLTGTGGIGKTRLALAVVSEVGRTYADGVVFVDLSPVRDQRLVASAVARAVGLQETSTRELEGQLLAHLRQRRVLLVVDNFEHVLEGAAFIAQVLAACPLVTVLATSRAPLRLRGERRYPVPPLEVPTEESADVLALSQSAAVALFVQRAQEVRPDFVLTQANAAAVAGICRRLDGLPLAIELAARRTHALPPRVLLVQLSDRLKLLVAGTRDMPDRQQTLRATLDWSYELLSAEQQVLLRRLAVFVGGCSLEAAQAVCDPEHALPMEVLDGLESLVDHSLVRQQGMSEDEARFGMLETVRDYALERLVASGEELALNRRHAQYFLDVAERIEPLLRTRERPAWAAVLRTEMDNIRSALSWSLSAAELETALRMVGALSFYWYNCGYLGEGHAWSARVLAADTARVPTAGRAKALNGTARLAFHWGDAATAGDYLQEAATIARTLKDPAQLAQALLYLGTVTAHQGKAELARQHYEESISLFEAVDDTFGRATALKNLATASAIIWQDDLHAARQLLESSVALYRKIGDAAYTSMTLNILGEVAHRLGEPEVARRLWSQSVATIRLSGETWQIAERLCDVGNSFRNLGDYSQAEAMLEESLRLFDTCGDAASYAEALHRRACVAFDQGNLGRARELLRECLGRDGDIYSTTDCLFTLACVLAVEGRAEQAARMLGATAALRKANGLLHPGLYERREYERLMQATSAALEEDRFAAVLAQGEAMSVKQAVAYARQALAGQLELPRSRGSGTGLMMQRPEVPRAQTGVHATPERLRGSRAPDCG